MKKFTEADLGIIYWHKLLKKPMLLVQLESEKSTWPKKEKWWYRRYFDGKALFRLVDKGILSHAWLYPWEFDAYKDQKENNGMGFGGNE